MDHIALFGRQIPAELTFFDRIMLKIGGLMNKDRKAGKQESQGFDLMDKSSIEPIVKLIEQFQQKEGLTEIE